MDIRFFQGASCLTILITADDFLHQMPALIAGTLIECGSGKRSPECIPAIFGGTEPECIPAIFGGTEKAGDPAEAKSLLLKNIQYPPSAD